MSAYSAAPGQHVCVCPPGNGGYLQETTSESSWEVGGQGSKRQSGCAVKMTACLVSATGWATGTSWAPASYRKAPSRHALSLHLLLFFGLTRFVNVQCCALLDHACSSAFIVCVCAWGCVVLVSLTSVFVVASVMVWVGRCHTMPYLCNFVHRASVGVVPWGAYQYRHCG